MTMYELSLSPDYVPSWTVVDAVRELFQNAIDQEVTQPDNKMFWSFDITDTIMCLDASMQTVGTLRIGNKRSVLNTKTLLLGSSSKANDDKTIGQFGEGYKVASLVLRRNHLPLTFYNYGAREVWRPRFKKSRKYGTEILVFDVDKQYIWNKVPDNDLTIEINDLPVDVWEQIVESNLHLQGDYQHIETSSGQILTDESHSGKVFVNGLYVCEHKPYTMGYNFKPGLLHLDRDRKLAKAFDLEWLSSKMYTDNDNQLMIDLAVKLSGEGAADVRFVSSNLWHKTSTVQKLVKAAHQDFVDKHGANAVPVSTQEELSRVPSTHNAVLVTDSHKEVIKASPDYVEVRPETRGLKVSIQQWLDTHQQSLSKKAIKQMQNIINGVDSSWRI